MDLNHLLKRVKTYLELGGDDTKDEVLLLMLEDAAHAVLSYCHVKNLNASLDSVVVQLVMRKFNQENSENLASIKMGDVSMSYTEPINAAFINDTDKAILNANRRVVLR